MYSTLGTLLYHDILAGFSSWHWKTDQIIDALPPEITLTKTTPSELYGAKIIISHWKRVSVAPADQDRELMIARDLVNDSNA